MVVVIINGNVIGNNDMAADLNIHCRADHTVIPNSVYESGAGSCIASVSAKEASVPKSSYLYFFSAKGLARV